MNKTLLSVSLALASTLVWLPAAWAVDVPIAIEPALAAKVFASLKDRGAQRVAGSVLAGMSVVCRAASACSVVLSPANALAQFSPNANGPFYQAAGKLFKLSPASSLALYRAMSSYDGRPTAKGAERFGGSMYAGASFSCAANAVDVLKATAASCTLQIFPRQR